MLLARRTIHRQVALVAAILTIAACGAPSATPTLAPGPTSAAPTPGPTAQPTGTPTAAPSATPSAVPSATAEPTERDTFNPSAGDLRWYCCLGTGEEPGQQEVENRIASGFSGRYPGSTLTFEAVTYDSAYDTLSTQIAGQNPPDLAGPVGLGGISAFHGQWLDLTPYIARSGYDLTQYAQNLVTFYQTPDGQVGIPFDVYPSMLWYKPSLFDEAGLNYPPHAYGDPYVMPDGTQVEWNYDTVREIALILTVDSSGKDATQEGFNPDDIVQYGFEPQRDDLRGLAAFWGAASLVASDGVTARVPDAWREAWKYFYDGMWSDHFIMTGETFDADEWGGSTGFAFSSGKVAMSENFLWTTYGVGADSGVAGDWDLAAVPAYNGSTTAPLNADTFAILKSSRNPDLAFAAVDYLISDKAAELLAPNVYGGMPARTADQAAYLDSLDAEFPHGVDWQVVTDSLKYIDVPNFEAPMPEYNQSTTILSTYLTKWTTTGGLDMDQEIAALEAALQTAWGG